MDMITAEQTTKLEGLRNGATPIRFGSSERTAYGCFFWTPGIEIREMGDGRYSIDLRHETSSDFLGYACTRADAIKFAQQAANE